MTRPSLPVASLSLLFSSFLLLSREGRAQGENLVPNPGFEGMGGMIVGNAFGTPGVPDNWRVFAVGGGASEIEVVPALADEIFPGSPETNVVIFRVTAFGQDQGFDDDNGRFPLIPGVEYHGEFWARSANGDGSDQTFNFGFPLFRETGVYLGREPGGTEGNTATSDWQLFVGPTFTDGEMAQGHISWRCLPDGGEDAIAIALPQVTAETTGVVPPTGLFCRKSGRDVELTWQNNDTYDSLRILRDGELLREIAPDDTSYTDTDVPEGTHTYQVVATAPGLEGGPSCEVSLFQVAPGTQVSVDLGDLDLEDGLANSQRQDGTDGENEFVICGPEDDLREGRANWGADDPTFDAPDGFFYFNVTDPAMKAQESFLLSATVYDDPLLFGAQLSLQYTNSESRGPGDIPNTFHPLVAPVTRTLEGTDAWIDLSWTIEGAGFRSFQQGTSDFRIGVSAGMRVCLDRVELTYVPIPANLTCARRGSGVELTWENTGTYDGLRILRDGEEIASLAGDRESHFDGAVTEGPHTYELVAVLGELELTKSCEVTVFFVPDGTRVSVDLGDLDVEDGLANTQRGDGTDGENEFVLCGPELDLREGRANWGAEDPTPDAADGFFYFDVTDQAMKAQRTFRLEATVYDDPVLTGVALFLQYTNSLATGPADIPNTFFPQEAPPEVVLEGTGEFVTLTWEIPDAGFRSFQQGTSDFRIGVAGGERVCLDRVELVFVGEGPVEPQFVRADVDQSGVVNLTDGVQVLLHLFRAAGLPAPLKCLDAADADDSGNLNLTDGVSIFQFLFRGGSIPLPSPETTGTTTAADPGDCGPDPTADNVTCAGPPPGCPS